MSPYSGAAAVGWPHPPVTMATLPATSARLTVIFVSPLKACGVSQDDTEEEICHVCEALNF